MGDIVKVSWSGGKDSTASVLLHTETGQPEREARSFYAALAAFFCCRFNRLHERNKIAHLFSSRF